MIRLFRLPASAGGRLADEHEHARNIKMIKTCHLGINGGIGQAILLLMLSLAMLLITPSTQAEPPQPSSAALGTTTDSRSAHSNVPFAAAVINPGSGLWREVRQRGGPIEGITQVSGTDAGILISTRGEEWRQLRTEKVIPYSGYLLAVVLAVLVLFRLIRGQLKIHAGRSGMRILRFTYSQRAVHWVAGITFVILGITGVVLLLGRTLLIPVMGNSAFGVIASFSKTVHDYLGPVFVISLVFLFIYYVKDNFFKLKDIQWFAKGGGMFGGHAHAGRFNAGEKTWFWLAILLGIVVSVTGLVLDFPIFGLDRETMELSLLIHGIAAIIVFGISFGHMYLATVGMEGALESMTTGYCDANWAKEHHDDWYEEVKDTAEPAPSEDSPTHGSPGQASPSGA